MGLADHKRPKKNLTDAEKNDRAADSIKKILSRAAKMQRRMVNNINRTIKNAPGSKAVIMNKLGDDKDEATAMLGKLKDFANTHKKDKDPKLT